MPVDVQWIFIPSLVDLFIVEAKKNTRIRSELVSESERRKNKLSRTNLSGFSQAIPYLLSLPVQATQSFYQCLCSITIPKNTLFSLRVTSMLWYWYFFFRQTLHSQECQRRKDYHERGTPPSSSSSSAERHKRKSYFSELRLILWTSGVPAAKRSRMLVSSPSVSPLPAVAQSKCV